MAYYWIFVWHLTDLLRSHMTSTSTIAFGTKLKKDWESPLSFKYHAIDLSIGSVVPIYVIYVWLLCTNIPTYKVFFFYLLWFINSLITILWSLLFGTFYLLYLVVICENDSYKKQYSKRGPCISQFPEEGGAYENPDDAQYIHIR